MSPDEELEKINEVLDMFKVPKNEGYAIYTTLGRVSWLARKSAQQSMHPTSETLRGKLALLTPEQLSALEVLLTPLTCG
jgi:hypothetical protein